MPSPEISIPGPQHPDRDAITHNLAAGADQLLQYIIESGAAETTEQAEQIMARMATGQPGETIDVALSLATADGVPAQESVEPVNPPADKE